MSPTQEEEWIVAQLAGSLGDNNPDAVAVRLHLSMALFYSPSQVPWKVDQQLDLYLKLMPHVSSAVRLEVNDLKDLIMKTKSATPWLKNQLKTFRGDEKKNTRELSGERLRWGGQPWMRLNLTQLQVLERYRNEVRRLQYVRRDLVEDHEIVNFIWKNELLMDNVSGSNSKLGFLFLYEIIKFFHKI